MTKQKYIAPELELFQLSVSSIGLLTDFSMEGSVSDFEGNEVDGF